MDYDAIPIIKLELKSMKHTMLTHLGLMNGELNKAVSEQLDNAIADFNFGRAVSSAANEAITDSINSYFKYGQGRHFIQDTIEEAFNKMFSNNNGEK